MNKSCQEIETKCNNVTNCDNNENDETDVV